MCWKNIELPRPEMVRSFEALSFRMDATENDSFVREVALFEGPQYLEN